MNNGVFGLEGQKILITGASSGIGRATAQLAAAQGAICIINGRDGTRLNETLPTLEGEGHIAIASELTPENCSVLVKEAVAKAGLLNGFVHCAGIEKTLPFRMTELSDLHEIMSINLDAYWEITKEILKKKNHEPQKLSRQKDRYKADGNGDTAANHKVENGEQTEVNQVFCL